MRGTAATLSQWAYTDATIFYLARMDTEKTSSRSPVPFALAACLGVASTHVPRSPSEPLLAGAPWGSLGTREVFAG